MSDETAYLQAVLDNENGADIHVVRIEYPYVGRYQAVCACGKYRSRACIEVGGAGWKSRRVVDR